MFETDFLTSQTAGAYRESVEKALAILAAAYPRQPYSGKSAAELGELLGKSILPGEPSALDAALDRLKPIIAHSLALTNPNTVAHFHPPPLLASLVGEVLISALNQSMDSFDQGPAATVLELAVSEWICRETEMPAGAGAIFTAGATQSNFMALLLARDVKIAAKWDWDVQRRGLPAEARKLRFLCSEVAHFTVEKSAYQLGLGTDAVIKIPVDDSFQMLPDALADALERLRQDGLIPAAIVGTAGSTDFASIDPLPELATMAEDSGAWFHVDAAYGSALLLSEEHRQALRGIERADSISIDFHKNFWQVISCGAFVLRNAAQFRHLEIHADYLNPPSHDATGIPNLVNRSLATTRRFDALKLWLSFQALGRAKFGQMVERTAALGVLAGKLIRETTELELVHEPQFGCVVFRYRTGESLSGENELNARLRQRLFDRGSAVIGHTRVKGRQCLKFTFMNPMISDQDVAGLVHQVVAAGREVLTGGADSGD